MSVRRGLPVSISKKSLTPKSKPTEPAEITRLEPRELGHEVPDFEDILAAVKRYLPKDKIKADIADIDSRINALEENIKSIQERINELRKELEEKEVELARLKREKRGLEKIFKLIGES